MKMFTVYDKEAKIYTPPFNAPTETHAMRTFRMQVNHKDTSNMLNFAPEHFTLYKVGEFNDQTGEINTHTPMIICEAIAVINKE